MIHRLGYFLKKSNPNYADPCLNHVFVMFQILLIFFSFLFIVCYPRFSDFYISEIDELRFNGAICGERQMMKNELVTPF